MAAGKATAACPGEVGLPYRCLRIDRAVRRYPDWLEFDTWRVGGPVATLRSRSGIVRVEAGEGEIAERVLAEPPIDGGSLSRERGGGVEAPFS